MRLGFEKLIETSVPAGACDTVAITSPIGTVTVQPEGERLVARVRLGPGDNVVEAECRKDGVRRGTPSIASNSASLEIQPDYYHASDFFGAFRSYGTALGPRQ